ncbi:MAG TPA: hypothetical protein PKA19_11310 [Bacillota bacterium]|nr:hypothetical protein [Bacillota bacterium]
MKNETKRRRWKRTLIAAAVIVAVLGTTAAAAASKGINILDMVLKPFSDRDAAVIQEELDNGQWAYLNGDNIAVIVPESPTKVLLSDDGGKTWKKVSVSGSGEGYHNGAMQKEMQYTGGYIGFSSKKEGYLVLTTEAALGSQDARIFLTADGGKNWDEIGNLNGIHNAIITGAGFASSQVGFISYRYSMDAGPDIWWTADRGKTWNRLEVKVPEQYQSERYRFTPLSPSFDGLNGVYPITVIDQSTPNYDKTTISMYSDDGGMSWSFRNGSISAADAKQGSEAETLDAVLMQRGTDKLRTGLKNDSADILNSYGIVRNVEELLWIAPRGGAGIEADGTEKNISDLPAIKESEAALTDNPTDWYSLEVDTDNLWIRLIYDPYKPAPGVNSMAHKDIMVYLDNDNNSNAYLGIQNPDDETQWTVISLPGYGSWFEREMDMIMRIAAGL